MSERVGEWCTWWRVGLTLVAAGAELEAAHLHHLAAALARGVQTDALEGALTLHCSLWRVGVDVPASAGRHSYPYMDE